jgi:hypothetical protein
MRNYEGVRETPDWDLQRIPEGLYELKNVALADSVTRSREGVI